MMLRFAVAATVAGCVSTALLAADAARAGQMPPSATTSSQCPAPDADTTHFAKATAYNVRTPHGRIALVAVRTDETRERGLMCVVHVPAGRGMLFVFPAPDRLQGFWMKNTLVGLDMVFVTADGTVSGIAANVPPTPNGTPDDAVARRQGLGRFVIELGWGDAARQGIMRGTKLILPALTAQQ